MHWYKKHIGDYRRRTSGLSLLGHGIYQQLIDDYYLNEGPFKMSLDDICFQIGAESEIEVRTTERVLRKYFRDTPDGWVHDHCEEVLEPYLSRCKKNKESGKLGGRPKKDDVENQSETNMVSTSNQSETIAGYNQLTNKPSKENNIHQSVIDECFDVFWEAGMRKVGKKPAYDKFARIIKSLPKEIEPLVFANALSEDIKQRIKNKQNGFDLMHPTTYLNQERWSDEQTNEVNTGANKQAPSAPASEQVSNAILESIYGQQQERPDDLVGDGKVIREFVDD